VPLYFLLKNEVALDFLENLKMGERVIKEIKNKKKEKYMEDEKIQISVHTRLNRI
jgi:hypothetical protein